MLTNSQELLGRTLGTFTIRRLLGRGGMGAVYLAQQSRPRRTVAVKVLLPNLVEDHPREEFLTRFRREADAVAALDHINIMPIYEYGEQGDIAYLAMPYVTGGTLRERLEKRSIPPLEETVQVIEQASAGLDSAHSQGIVHRDLKPGNILFHADGRILLADFGLAKVMNEFNEDSGLSVLTNTGTIVGTPEYLSPEQGSGDPLDYRTDVYSLGVVLYQMLAGRVPFVGTSPVAVAIKHTLETPPPLTRFNPDVPHNIEAVVMKALAKKPDERFSSAGELARALREATVKERATHIWHAPSSQISQPLPVSEPIRERTKPEQSTFDQYTEPEKSGDKRENGFGQVQAHAENVPETPYNPDAREQVVALPTVVMPAGAPDTEELHASETEETPRLSQESRKVLASMPTVFTTADPTIGNEVPAMQSSKKVPVPPTPPPMGREPVMEQRVLSDQAHIHVPPIQPAHVQVRPYAAQSMPGRSTRVGRLPAWMILASIVLIGVVIIGGVFALQNMNPSGKANNNNPTPQTSTGTPTQVAGETPTQSNTPQATEPTPIPVSALPPLPAGLSGSMVYASLSPTCDKQGTWTQVSGGSGTCTEEGLNLASNGPPASVFLESTPDGSSLPDNLIMQVQVKVNPNTGGSFGVHYRTQPGESKKGYMFMITPHGENGTWTAYSYTETGNGGMYEALNRTPVPTLTKIQDIVTITIQLRGNTFDFYINGNAHIGGAISGGQYSSGMIGLVADQGANVTFKNLAVYNP